MKDRQIDPYSAINCGIQEIASNKNTTKYKHLFGVKNLLKFIQWFARYKILALLGIFLFLLLIVERRNFCFADIVSETNQLTSYYGMIQLLIILLPRH